MLVALDKLEVDIQLLHSHPVPTHFQSIAELEFQVEQLVQALNLIEEDELWGQSEDNSPYYMIDEDTSSSSHYELIQANIPLRSEDN
jgi:hypothetical protein